MQLLFVIQTFPAMSLSKHGKTKEMRGVETNILRQVNAMDRSTTLSNDFFLSTA